MRRLDIALLALFALVTAGCATGVPVDVQLPQHAAPKSLSEVLANARADLGQDLQAADTIAQAHNDVLAHACYPVLAKYLAAQATTGAPADKVTGAVSGYEELRVQRRAAEAKIGQGGIPDDLRLGCAALLQDERDFYIKLDLMILGGAAGAPGIGSALGGAAAGLPAVLGPMLAPLK